MRLERSTARSVRAAWSRRARVWRRCLTIPRSVRRTRCAWPAFASASATGPGRSGGSCGGAEAWTSASPEPLLSHVQGLLPLRDEPDALSTFERLAERWPDRPAVLFGRGRLLQRDGRRGEALALIERALSGSPGAWPYHQARLKLLLTERPAEVDAALDRIAEIWPHGAQRYAAAVSVRLSRGALDEALADIAKQIAAAPNAVPPRMQEARLLGRLGRTAEAERRLRGLVAERPDAPAPHLALVDRLSTDGRLDEALTLLLGPSPPALPRTREVRARLWPILARLDRLDALREEVEGTPFDALPPAGAIVRATQALQGRADDLAVMMLERAIRGSPAPDPAITKRLLTLISAHMPTNEIEKRIAALGSHLPPAVACRVRARALERAGEAEAALRALRRLPTAERREGDVAMIGRLLHGRHRRALALRYLSVHARAWPGLGRTVAILHAQQGNIAAAWERFAALDATLPAPARRQLELTLAVQTGRGSADAALLEEVERSGFASAIQPILRQALAVGDIRLADEACERLLDHRGMRRSHWSISVPGQLLSDLRLAETVLGTSGLAALCTGSLADLARAVKAQPKLYAPAAMLVSRIGPSGRRAGNEGSGDTGEAGGECRSGGSPRDGNDADRPTTDPPSAPSRPIPLHVYQYWNDDPPPEAVAALVESWASAPGVGHTFLNRRSTLEWLAGIGPDWTRAFRMANNPAEEADFLRLVVLWRLGGVWADADDCLLGDVTRLTAGGGLVVFQEPMGNTIANNVLAACPRHPVLAYAAETAKADLLSRSNESTWQKTGPGLLTRAVAQFAARSILEGGSNGRTGTLPFDITIHPQSALRREVGIHTRLPHKADAAYWNAKREADPGYGALLDRVVEWWRDKGTRCI